MELPEPEYFFLERILNCKLSFFATGYVFYLGVMPGALKWNTKGRFPWDFFMVNQGPLLEAHVQATFIILYWISPLSPMHFIFLVKVTSPYNILWVFGMHCWKPACIYTTVFSSQKVQVYLLPYHWMSFSLPTFPPLFPLLSGNH